MKERLSSNIIFLTSYSWWISRELALRKVKRLWRLLEERVAQNLEYSANFQANDRVCFVLWHCFSDCRNKSSSTKFRRWRSVTFVPNDVNIRDLSESSKMQQV